MNPNPIDIIHDGTAIFLMCILFVTVSSEHLICCSNRDEYTNRDTAVADFANFPDRLLCGKDLRAGGTWLGINADNGRFATVLNVAPSETMPSNSPSRGELPLLWLRAPANMSPSQFMAQLLASEEGTKRRYNGFSLIIAERDIKVVHGNVIIEVKVVWGTNSYGQERGKVKMHTLHASGGGTFAFTNDGRMYAGPGPQSIMYWPKARRGWSIMNSIIESEKVEEQNSQVIERLMKELLHCTTIDDVFSDSAVTAVTAATAATATTAATAVTVATDVTAAAGGAAAAAAGAAAGGAADKDDDDDDETNYVSNAQKQSDEWSEYVSNNRNLAKKSEVPIFLEWSGYATRTCTIVQYSNDGRIGYFDTLFDGSDPQGTRRTVYQSHCEGHYGGKYIVGKM